MLPTFAVCFFYFDGDAFEPDGFGVNDREIFECSIMATDSDYPFVGRFEWCWGELEGARGGFDGVSHAG